VPQSIWLSAQGELAQETLCGIVVVQAEPFEPCQQDHWLAASPFLHDEFLWLPWNWVTHERALASLSLSAASPADWSWPIQIQTNALVGPGHARVEMERRPEGLAVTSSRTAAEAERMVIAGSDTLPDGIYSTFNRALCRPIVRLLSHTAVTPNVVTISGLVVAILSGWMFVRGFYLAYMVGALLFFLSGLCDEIDGTLARITFSESAFDKWFQGFVTSATNLLVFTGITIGLYRQNGRPELLWGLALIAGAILSVLVINVQRKSATLADRHMNVLPKKAVAIHYLLLLTLFGGLTLFLRLAAIGANLTWILALYFSHRFFQRSTAAAPAREMQTAA
jgi:phosphatidylglycerophosphate synthase